QATNVISGTVATTVGAQGTVITAYPVINGVQSTVAAGSDTLPAGTSSSTFAVMLTPPAAGTQGYNVVASLLNQPGQSPPSYVSLAGGAGAVPTLQNVSPTRRAFDLQATNVISGTVATTVGAQGTVITAYPVING